MPHDPYEHLVHAALHEKDSRLAAVVLIVMGIFFTPMLIGIPILIVGICRLCK